MAKESNQLERTVTFQREYDVTRHGVRKTVSVDYLSESIVSAIFHHGLAAKVGDAAAGAATAAGESHFGKPRKEVKKADWTAWADSKAGQKAIGDMADNAMQAVIDALYDGQWSQRGSGITGPRLPDDEALAVKNAKSDLLVTFKKLTGQVKIADMVNHEKVAPFFMDVNDSTVWRDDVVLAWVQKRAESGARDYIAEARAALAVDLDDLDL